MTLTAIEDETVTPFCVAITPHCCEPSSAEVSTRASTSRVVPEIATVPAGLAPRVPANNEPSDIDTEKVATVVPAGELSGRDVVVVTNVMPVGVGRDGEAMTLIIKVAEPLNVLFIPTARTRTG
jgi:hypothetical protein